MIRKRMMRSSSSEPTMMPAMAGRLSWKAGGAGSIASMLIMQLDARE
jgi:hypothetical protein